MINKPTYSFIIDEDFDLPGKLNDGMMEVLLMTTLLVILLTSTALNSWGSPPSKPGLQARSRLRWVPRLVLHCSGGSGGPEHDVSRILTWGGGAG